VSNPQHAYVPQDNQALATDLAGMARELLAHRARGMEGDRSRVAEP
jgi:hypothetical protein